MMIRHLDKEISNHFNKYREILILLGARQVGKTTILRRLFPQAQYLTTDTEPIKAALDKYDPAVYKQLLNKDKSSLVILDEIQRLKDPGRAAKIFFDQLTGYRLIITGSSAFNIKNRTSESLAGRKIDYYLYPLTLSEYSVQSGLEKRLSYDFFEKISAGKKFEIQTKGYDKQAIFDNLLIYGTYPAMLDHQSDPVYLINLIDSVVFKDLMEMSLLENKSAALAMLKLLAYQIGSPVNCAELATKLGIGAVTVKRYLELFERGFVVFTLKPFSRRKRDEIAKMPKVYFYDLGLRNALINNFEPVSTRGDVGQMFENFIVTEIFKLNSYGNFGYKLNYWRTKAGSEVDLVLSKGNKEIIALEIKLQAKRINKAFISRYPQAKMSVITRDNFWI